MASNPPHQPLKGKFAIITGGSRGIGAAIARNLASKGCSLLLNYTSASSSSPTESLCSELSSTHSIKCVSIRADLSDPTTAAPLIVSAAKEHFSSPDASLVIDILINNAGIASDNRLADPSRGPIEPTQFHLIYTVNVLAPILLTQACLPFFPSTGTSGRIINVSSVSSSLGFEGQTIYGGSKAALESMTRTWARELAGRCTVNAVNPGPVWGDMYAQTGEAFWRLMQGWQENAPGSQYEGEEEVKAMAAEMAGGNDTNRREEGEKFDDLVRTKMAGRRPAFTSEVAGVVGMLCSEESKWCTGSVVCCNGGMRMGT